MTSSHQSKLREIKILIMLLTVSASCLGGLLLSEGFFIVILGLRIVVIVSFLLFCLFIWVVWVFLCWGVVFFLLLVSFYIFVLLCVFLNC